MKHNLWFCVKESWEISVGKKELEKRSLFNKEYKRNSPKKYKV